MNILQKTAAALGVMALAFAAVWLSFVMLWMEQVPRKYEAAFSHMARSAVAEAPGPMILIGAILLFMARPFCRRFSR